MSKPYFIFHGMAYAGMDTDANPPEIELHPNEYAANHSAYEQALEDCDTWEGSHGVPYFTDDEDTLAADPDNYEHIDERDNHIEYYVIEATPEEIKKQSDNWIINYQKELDELLKK